METTYQLLVSFITVATLLAATLFAYHEGYMDPLIEKLGISIMKVKAKAEEKQMEAQGLKRGEDFADSELKGNQQAEDLKAGVGSLGGLKKSL